MAQNRRRMQEKVLFRVSFVDRGIVSDPMVAAVIDGRVDGDGFML